jgi:hypothetical protein
MSLAKYLITGMAAATVLSAPVFAAVTEQQEAPLYMSITGKITDVTEAPAEGQPASEQGQLVKISYGAESAANFFIQSDSYNFTGVAPSKDLSFIGFYNTQLPITLIYPPTYGTVVYAVDLPDGQSIKVDKFDENMLSYDKDLKLNIGDTTKIITPDGKKYDGGLTDKRLAVLYAITTRSMPPQTTPLRIVVLPDDTTESSDQPQATEVSPVTAMPPLHILTDEEKEMLKKDYASMKITVNGKTVDGAQAALTADGEGLLPLRAIVESMGLTVEWFADTRTVQIGKSASLVIGRDAYSVNRATPQELGIAPQLIKDRTYVPFAFFDQIVRAPIVIKDGNTIDLTYPVLAAD